MQRLELNKAAEFHAAFLLKRTHAMTTTPVCGIQLKEEKVVDMHSF